MEITKQNKLILFYKNRLDKVKLVHNPNDHKSEIFKERCKEYIKFAKQELKAVKNGRNW